MSRLGAHSGDAIAGFIGSFFEAVFFDFAVEGAFADAEDFGGLFAVAVDGGEGFFDGLFFELGEVFSGESEGGGGLRTEC